MNTMTVDHETEAQIAKETGHQLGCLEWWMETALEAGADEHDVYALWYQEVDNGFAGPYGTCHCEE